MDEEIDLTAMFGTADSVLITDNLNRRLATCADADAIERLGGVLGTLGDGWHVPPEGVPVARLRLNFRRGDETLGNLGVAGSFLAAHVHGTFLARESDVQTSTMLLEALDADGLVDRL
jgi:hypothetical protein